MTPKHLTLCPNQTQDTRILWRIGQKGYFFRGQKYQPLLLGTDPKPHWKQPIWWWMGDNPTGTSIERRQSWSAPEQNLTETYKFKFLPVLSNLLAASQFDGQRCTGSPAHRDFQPTWSTGSRCRASLMKAPARPGAPIYLPSSTICPPSSLRWQSAIFRLWWYRPRSWCASSPCWSPSPSSVQDPIFSQQKINNSQTNISFLTSHLLYYSRKNEQDS